MGNFFTTSTSANDTNEAADARESYSASEHQPINIENNSSIVSITTCGQCNSDASKSSDITAVANELTNININISKNFGIIIISHKGQFNLDVQPNNTIEDVKSKIRDKEGIAVGEQKLYFGGEDLQNHRTLSNCNIENGSTVQLVFRLRGGMKVFVKTLNGSTLTIYNIDGKTTMEELKEEIYKATIDLPNKSDVLTPDSTRLIFAGKQLEDGRTLSDYIIFRSSQSFM